MNGFLLFEKPGDLSKIFMCNDIHLSTQSYRQMSFEDILLYHVCPTFVPRLSLGQTWYKRGTKEGRRDNSNNWTTQTQRSQWYQQKY